MFLCFVNSTEDIDQLYIWLKGCVYGNRIYCEKVKRKERNKINLFIHYLWSPFDLSY